MKVDFPKVTLKQPIQTMKQRLMNVLQDYIGEPITEAMECEIFKSKQDFLAWIKMHRLDYLFDMNREKTLFEWKVTVDIMDILMHFDELIEQHDKQFGKPVDRINNALREQMTDFSEEYEDESIIDEVYTSSEFELNVLKLKRLVN